MPLKQHGGSRSSAPHTRAHTPACLGARPARHRSNRQAAPRGDPRYSPHCKRLPCCPHTHCCPRAPLLRSPLLQPCSATSASKPPRAPAAPPRVSGGLTLAPPCRLAPRQPLAIWCPLQQMQHAAASTPPTCHPPLCRPLPLSYPQPPNPLCQACAARHPRPRCCRTCLPTASRGWPAGRTGPSSRAWRCGVGWLGRCCSSLFSARLRRSWRQSARN